jgi:hypothetical protein
MTQLSTEYPSRVPGTPGAAGAARWYEQTVAGYGFVTKDDTWHQNVPGLGDVGLDNIVTVIPGRSAQAIVIVAHRDNQGAARTFGENASGTAALIELARGYGPQESAQAARPQRTVVLVSTDAGAYGGAGAVRFVRTSPYARDALAAVVLDGIAGRGLPLLAIAGDESSSPSPTLVGTAVARIGEQTGVVPAIVGVPTQLVDLGVPYAAGEQGAFLGGGVAAVTLTTAEREDPAIPAGDSGPVSTKRLGQLGRATEALLGSIDESVGRSLRTPDSLFFRGRAASGWAARLTLVVAVVPFALGVLDLVVRGRRKKLHFAPALRGLRTRALFWLYAGLLLWIGALTGVLPSGAALPLPPTTAVVTDPPVAGVAVLSLALALGWLVGRRQLVSSERPSSEDRLAGYTIALAWLAVVAVAMAVTRPYALIFVLPSLYSWLWLPLRTRFWTRAVVYCLGLVGPALGLGLLAHELDLSLARAFLYTAGLVSVGYVSAGTVLVALAWFAAASQLGALAFGRYAPYAGGAEPPPPGVVRETIGAIGRRARTRL